MGWFEHDSDEAKAYHEVTNAPHKAALSHELIAAAASYEAAKAYEQHVARNNGGVPVEHAKAKEFLAAAAGGFIDKLVESKGLDFIDKEKAKRHAHERNETALDVSRNQF
ncbi:putative phosphoglycerate mutase family protein [Irpex lacteus]|nr:putative phosphoglycerate mutase family protein [Irpex lacteus]